MFEDEAGFGRISTPAYCWCEKGIRPSVPCHHIREYDYVFGAVSPADGRKFFLILPQCNMVCMNTFLHKLSEYFSGSVILLICDNASWHKSNELMIYDNIVLSFIPPYTPEMNPIEQIWTEIRKRGFKNVAFHSLDAVSKKLCEVINGLSNMTVKSITSRKWIANCYS
ncbi:MAG: IS630 family transposase [Clostridiales bacterium]|nr:IS630 family transposase [Clostridiales bacterium]